jgi:hypothetical protein
MDNLQWVIKGGVLLGNDWAASLGCELIEKAGMGKKMLKAKFQRKDWD